SYPHPPDWGYPVWCYVIQCVTFVGGGEPTSQRSAFLEKQAPDRTTLSGVELIKTQCRIGGISNVRAAERSLLYPLGPFLRRRNNHRFARYRSEQGSPS